MPGIFKLYRVVERLRPIRRGGVWVCRGTHGKFTGESRLEGGVRGYPPRWDRGPIFNPHNRKRVENFGERLAPPAIPNLIVRKVGEDGGGLP